MDDFDYRPDENELSINSIGRLKTLQQILKDSKNLLEQKNIKRSLVLGSVEEKLSQRKFKRTEPLFIAKEFEEEARHLVVSIEDTILNISGCLDQEWHKLKIESDFRENRDFDEPVWSLGSVVYRLDRRPILRGNIELCKTELIGTNIPEALVQFFITIKGTRDQLTRESHGHWGYHYHYIDDKKRRSDTLLTFDHRASNVQGPTLCWERHAEGQKFKARADQWGTEKRKSVYSACIPDTVRFNLKDFKCPKNDAKVIWP